MSSILPQRQNQTKNKGIQGDSEGVVHVCYLDCVSPEFIYV